MFEGFETKEVDVGPGALAVRTGGQGPAVLLLHGFPQTSAAWAAVAPLLAQSHSVVVPDLPGYGQSYVPAVRADHAAHSKRAWAEQMVTLMDRLGHRRFAVAGHDRGARVAYRMALDHPRSVTRLAILDVVPTADMWNVMDADLAISAYHWPFLAQPAPMPETLISGNPHYYLHHTLKSWTACGTLDPFAPPALSDYRLQMATPQRVEAMCEDYRAGATVDRSLDERTRASGQKIRAPLHFIYGEHGFAAKTGAPLELWRGWAETITAEAVAGGHFSPEENPGAVARMLMGFLAT